MPQVSVTINREAAAQYGLTAASIGAAVRSELTGETATTVTIDNEELDVVVMGDGAAARQPWTSCTPLLSAASAHHTGHFGARLLGAITLEPRCNTSRQFRHNTNAILKIFLVQKGPLLMHERDERTFTIRNVG